MLKSKIHGARVTGLCLDYEGSITLDANLMAEADILPYEQVQVLNMNNGARFTTYAITGPEGSGQVCLNGAAARLASKGDTVIILSYSLVADSEAAGVMPRLLHTDRNNNIETIKQATEAIPF
jgi:aspartate 1-decarboxylase